MKTAPCSSQCRAQTEVLKYCPILLDKRYVSGAVQKIPFFQWQQNLGGPGTIEDPSSYSDRRLNLSARGMRDKQGCGSKRQLRKRRNLFHSVEFGTRVSLRISIFK